MVFVIDVGNTNVVFGVFNNDGKLVNFWRRETSHKASADELGVFVLNVLKLEGIEKKDINHVMIASVVPNTMYTVTHMVQKYFGLEAFILDSNSRLNFTIGYDNPAQLGADRIANVVGALEKYKPPFIIIDMGTATTFCCVDENRRYLGGSIVPGITISTDALYQRTALLTRVELERADKYICTNTHQSIQSGAYFGYIGLIEHIVSGMKKEMNADPLVIATGGLTSLIVEDTKCFDVIDKNITLEGMYHIYRMNNEY